METFMKYYIAGFLMIGLSVLLMFVGIKYQNLLAEIFSMAIAIAGAISLFRGLLEYLQRVVGRAPRR